MRQIQICRVHFCLGVILRDILKRGEHDHTKMYLADLNSPHRELSNGGIGIVAHSPSGSLANYFLCAHNGKAIRL